MFSRHSLYIVNWHFAFHWSILIYTQYYVHEVTYVVLCLRTQSATTIEFQGRIIHRCHAQILILTSSPITATNFPTSCSKSQGFWENKKVVGLDLFSTLKIVCLWVQSNARAFLDSTLSRLFFDGGRRSRASLTIVFSNQWDQGPLNSVDRDEVLRD